MPGKNLTVELPSLIPSRRPERQKNYFEKEELTYRLLRTKTSTNQAPETGAKISKAVIILTIGIRRRAITDDGMRENLRGDCASGSLENCQNAGHPDGYMNRSIGGALWFATWEDVMRVRLDMCVCDAISPWTVGRSMRERSCSSDGLHAVVRDFFFLFFGKGGITRPGPFGRWRPRKTDRILI